MIKEKKSSELHGSESSCMSKTLLVFLWLMQRVYGHMVSGQQHHLDFYYTSSDVQHCCPWDFTVCYRGLTHKIEKVITALKTGDCYIYKRKKDREKREREGNRKGSNFFLGIFSSLPWSHYLFRRPVLFHSHIKKINNNPKKTKTAPVYRSYLVVLLLKNIFSLSYYCCCFQAINWKIHDPVSSIQLQLIVIVLPLSSGSKRGYKRQHERMCGSKGLQQFKREWVVWAELNDFCAMVSS